MLRKIILILALISILTIPVMVLADSYGLDAAAPQDLKTIKLGKTVPEVVGGIIGIGLSLLGIVFFLLILYAGFLWMTALGNSTKADKAKEIMEAAGIGLIIVLSAYAITTFLFNKVGGTAGTPGTGDTAQTTGSGTSADQGCCISTDGSKSETASDACGSGNWTQGPCTDASGSGNCDSLGGQCLFAACGDLQPIGGGTCSDNRQVCCAQPAVAANDCEQKKGGVCMINSCDGLDYVSVADGICPSEKPNCCKQAAPGGSKCCLRTDGQCHLFNPTNEQCDGGQEYASCGECVQENGWCLRPKADFPTQKECLPASQLPRTGSGMFTRPSCSGTMYPTQLECEQERQGSNF